MRYDIRGESMHIAVVGTGYVGLVTGTCLSDAGHTVFCVDIDQKKIEKLNAGIVPIYEPGLSEMISKNVSANRLHFTTRLEDVIGKCKICFIAVGTPMSSDGSANLTYVYDVANKIGELIEDYTIIVDKSTVPVGTADEVRRIIGSNILKRGKNIEFDVVSNPEFLKEGSAILDFYKPDRVVIGAPSSKSKEYMVDLYRTITADDKIITMDVRSAEMTKYAANAMLATKISFINEISNICELVGADIINVRTGIGMDKRIGFNFINPGCGYGGSCFPKDVRALIELSKEKGYDSKILKSVDEINLKQKHILSEKIIKKYGKLLKDYTFAIWGLAFKPETDDVRESPALELIEDLTNAGAKVVVNDPKAMEIAKEFYLKDNDSVAYSSDMYEMLTGSDALIIVTDWNQYINADYSKAYNYLKGKVIFDGRNILNKEYITNLGFECNQLGRGNND